VAEAMGEDTAQGMAPTPEGKPMTAERIAYLGSVSMTREEGYEVLAEIDRLNTVLDANRVVRNAAESSSRTYKSVVDMLKIQRTELRDEIDRCAGLNRDLVNENAELSTEIDRLRANQPQLTDEYGLRIRYVSTLTEERAIADTLDGALEVLAAFDAQGRESVVSRELLVRGVEEWRKAAEG